jgi:hypothetical protein
MKQQKSKRVEFYGGPNDGEVVYKREADLPTDIFHSVVDLSQTRTTSQGLQFHHYSLEPMGEHLLKYVYRGIIVGT